MTKLPNAVSQLSDIGRLYHTLSQDSRYGHFVRIPERICRCLDYFKVSASHAAVSQRLHCYYLFIGVVDEVIDSSELAAGREILEQLDNRTPSFDEETKQSRARLATEVLKCHIDADIYATVLGELQQLYRAVVRERYSRTSESYIEERKAVGRLTAKLSYLLISPLLDSEREDFCRFLQDVGEVGCLLDSVIDLRSDHRLGLISFNPTLKDRLRIIVITLRLGITLSLKHPRLFVLFLEAVGDNLLDRLRPIAGDRRRHGLDPVVENRRETTQAPAEPLSCVAWTKP